MNRAETFSALVPATDPTWDLRERGAHTKVLTTHADGDSDDHCITFLAGC